MAQNLKEPEVHHEINRYRHFDISTIKNELLKCATWIYVKVITFIESTYKKVFQNTTEDVLECGQFFFFYIILRHLRQKKYNHFYNCLIYNDICQRKKNYSCFKKQ